MDMKLEVVVLAVADVGRAKDFYDQPGWRLDAGTPGSQFPAARDEHETASARQTGTGATGTPRTWWPSRPRRSCRDDQL